MSIYVEILIRASMDALWEHTQNPALHERWDLRFSRIEYLPHSGDRVPQRFRYATRIGFGIEIAGEGESLGERDLPQGCRVSSLKFSSEDPRSIIREGSGYWKYISTPDGIRFLTWYDYRTQFGWAGAVFDRVVFRPLLGWATAWSFDRLRLWLERGQQPGYGLRQFVTHATARGALAAVFAYHGLVPKLLLRDAGEVAMLRDAQVPAGSIAAVLTGAGVAEIAFALVLLLFWHRRWPAILCLVLMLAATVTAAVYSPRYLGAAFNPVSLNLCVAALALVDLLGDDDVPSAARCRRTPPPGDP
ncbi:MAG: DoxX-like family protein [Isosphaerales bacterium]